jgi:DNA-binding GntR family transcriptional regulator
MAKSLVSDPAALDQLRNASEIAADLIRTAIFDGRIEAGQRLKEVDLAREFGLSRTPIREALLLLQAEGIIIGSPKRGSHVRAYTREEVIDLYDIRAHLESFAARLAAERATDAQIAALRESCARYTEHRRSGDLLALGEENLRFHFGVAEASGSAKLLELVRSSIEQPVVHRSFRAFNDAEQRSSTEMHIRVTEAIASRSGFAAEAAMRRHVMLGRGYWMAQDAAGPVG